MNDLTIFDAEGRSIVISLFGICGTASGSHRHVTKIEICKSRGKVDDVDV